MDNQNTASGSNPKTCNGRGTLPRQCHPGRRHHSRRSEVACFVGRIHLQVTRVAIRGAHSSILNSIICIALTVSLIALLSVSFKATIAPPEANSYYLLTDTNGLFGLVLKIRLVWNSFHDFIKRQRIPSFAPRGVTFPYSTLNDMDLEILGAFSGSPSLVSSRVSLTPREVLSGISGSISLAAWIILLVCLPFPEATWHTDVAQRYLNSSRITSKAVPREYHYYF